MERVFRLKLPLACLNEADDIPEGALAMEPRWVGGGDDYIFLGSTDDGQTWHEYRTIIEDRSAWFELTQSNESLL